MKPAHRRPRAFSLVELLVVIAIIGIVIAILIPALRGARIQARKVSTQSTLRDLSNACNQFTNDHHRNPGHFSPAQMGAAANVGANGGFTGMQNLLLDISGGVTKASGPGILTDVGPGGATALSVDVTKIGGSGPSSKAYFTPDKSLLVADSGLVGKADNKLMPQVVDAFGNPILAWVADERPAAAFAAENSGTLAKFYWASNAGVLQATAIGRDQRDHNNGGSMLGGGYSAADRVTTMAALLGNPVFPKANLNPQVPERPRGDIVFQSPGADGFFMGRFDRGTKTSGTPAASPTMIMYNGAGVDVLTNFDDITQAAGL